MKFFALVCTIFMMLLIGCSPEKHFEVGSTPTVEKTETSVVEEKPSPTFTPTVVSTTTPEPKEDVIDVCSPFVDFPIENLVDMISNSYYPPTPGSDDPHQGVDFSVIDPDLRIALKGSAVQSVLAGEVVMVMNDRFPYGNAVLVETTFDKIPVGWVEKLKNQTQPDVFGTNPSLTCPTGWDQPDQENNNLSLYILYAHLDTSTAYTLGDQVDCGDGIGSIGDSGNALAPHLHIEMRYGYSSDIEGSMSHYTVSADEQEMRNYCRWRVSGWYRIMDPMDLFFTPPNP
jgi:murein DD-endopeptidase MepM/ murein hydrolase activator NlpD